MTCDHECITILEPHPPKRKCTKCGEVFPLYVLDIPLAESDECIQFWKDAYLSSIRAGIVTNQGNSSYTTSAKKIADKSLELFKERFKK